MNSYFKSQSFIIYIILLFIVLLFFLNPLFTERANAEDLAPPIITIVSPENNTLLNTNNVLISGKVSDDVTLPELIKLEVQDSNNTVINTLVPIASTGEWTYEVSNLTNGDYTFFIKATDEAGKTDTKSVTFSVNLSRPFVLPNVFPAMDQTHVPLDTSIRVTLSDDQLIKIIRVPDPIFVFTNEGSVIGSSTFDSISQMVTFTPAAALLPNKKYFVSVNPAITDDAGNKIFPRYWSFTTASIPEIEDPHGNYTHNVNTCVNCHGTHVSKGSKLENEKYAKPNTDNYCMACHDGTAAPMPENMDKAHKHNFNLDPELAQKSGTCTGCHNPHLTWSESNPNMFKDHWTYDHPNSTNETHDTMDILCEKCHDRVTTYKKDAAQVQYNVFQYRKSTTASGLKDDFALCLRCHDGSKAKTNIIQFYDENIVSGHTLTAIDGSPLAGQIPCAECHDTHGSNNVKLLRDKLGHENRMDFSEATGDWDAAKERSFCTKCHNGTTAIYGVTARFTIATPGHEASNLEACSKCHGGTSQSFLEAAHAPKRAHLDTGTISTSEQATDSGNSIATDPTSGNTTESTNDSGAETPIVPSTDSISETPTEPSP